MAQGFRPIPGMPDEVPGEKEVTVEGVTFELGAKVLLQPGLDGDPFDRILHGRTATIERLMIDYDDRVHIGVTIDGDPAQDLLRETGRYLFFFPHQVEAIR